MPTPSAMTSRERVRTALSGGQVDRPPVALWRHFPEQDQTAGGLAAATLDWQARFGFDLVKFMPPGDYPTIDWGAVSIYEGAPGGTRRTTRFPIARSDDWVALPPLDVRRGFLGVVLDALTRTRAALDPDVPLLQTVFGPLTVAAKLSGGLAVEHLRSHPAPLHEGLQRITAAVRDTIEASFAAGADGLFFATQLADFDVLDETEYRVFGLPYDLEVLAAAGASQVTILHLHGDAPMFDLQARYPVHALNWHDRRVAPNLTTGQQLSERCVCGGLDERRIAERSQEEAAAEARDAVARTGGRHLIVAPGCVIPVATPEPTIRAIVDAVATGAA